MSTAIAVTSPDLALPALDPHTPHAHVLALEGQSLDDTLSQTRLLLDQHGYLIVLHSSAVPPRARQRLHAVRSVLESDRIALVRSELPPLGLAVLVRQLRQLSTADLTPGVLAGSIRLLSHYIHAGALLNSVSKLDNVPVPLSSHARSWMPGSQFAVLASPAPQLIRVGSGPKVLEGPDYATSMTTAASHFGSDWVSETLAERWRVASLEPAPLPAESARWWGSGKLVEFAAAIPDISLLYQLVCSVRRARCHWCGLELIGDRCVFCRAPVPAQRITPQAPPTRPAPDRPAPPPASTSTPPQWTAPGAPTAPAPQAGPTTVPVPPYGLADPRATAPPPPPEEPPARPALDPAAPSAPPHDASRLTQARTSRLPPSASPFDAP